MKYLTLVFSLMLSEGFSQNLVPNYSFEDISDCNIVTNELNCTYWFNPNYCSPDNFHTCSTNSFLDIPDNIFGYQFARTGSGYAGFLSTGEFIEVTLSQKLKLGVNYCVEFYVCLSNNSQFAIDELGCYFSISPLYGDTLLDGNDSCEIILQPQILNPLGNVIKDTLNWILVQGEILGNGEEYLSIGSFSKIEDINDIDTVSALSGYFGYYYVDDVAVYLCDDTTIYESNLYPNPNNGNFTLNYNLGESIKGKFKVYNSIGQLVYQSKLTQNNGSQNFGLNLAAGVYVWLVEVGDAILRKDKFIVIK